jgi:hypothetical protein
MAEIPTKIQVKSSVVNGAVPPAEILDDAELALNRFTGCLYYKNAAGVVTLLVQAGFSPNHNDLLNLDGGDTGEYYHLSHQEYDDIIGYLTSPPTGNHNDLSSLDGGDTDEYYHLSHQEYDDIIAMLQSPPATDHNDLSSLDGGTSAGGGEYYHLTSAQHSRIDHRSIQFSGDLFGAYQVLPDWRLLDMSRSSAIFPSGITITSWYMDCSSTNPATELDADLMWCDASDTGAFPGASQTLIDVLNTTEGNSNCTNMATSDQGSGIVATNKILYFHIGADPSDANVIWTLTVNYTINP